MKRITIAVSALFVTSLFAQTQSADRTIPAVTQPTYTPPTAHDRLVRYLKSTVDPMAFVRSGASAGFGQWRDRPKEWGEGSEAFGKRYLSSFAQHITISTLLYGSSSLFHEDNQYIRSTETGFGPRFRYALESGILARHADGTRHLSISKISSFLGAAFISRAWQPHSSRGMRAAAASFGVTMGVSTGFDVVREFLPDLLHRK